MFRLSRIVFSFKVPLSAVPSFVLLVAGLCATPLIWAVATPTFVLKDLVTGQTTPVTVGELARLRVYVFLSSKCPCSIDHQETLRKLATTYASEVEFVGINSNGDEPFERSANHFSKVRFPFPVLRDEGAQLANHFGAVKTPHVYVVDRKGALVYQGGIDNSHEAGRASEHYLEAVLTAVHAGKAPPYTEKRTLGCAIKRP